MLLRLMPNVASHAERDIHQQCHSRRRSSREEMSEDEELEQAKGGEGMAKWMRNLTASKEES